jgi:hypothetical protein
MNVYMQDREIRRRAMRKTAVVVAIAALIAAGSVALLWRPPPREAVHVKTEPLVPSAMAVLTEREPVAATTQARATPQAAASAAAAAKPPSPDEVFKRLAAPGASYREHAEAYRMASDCMKENGPYGVRLERPVVVNGKTIAGPCELAPGTWQDLETRKRLVTECAEAGLCAAQMFAESPSSPYGGAFTQAEFDALQAKARAKGLEVGDPFVLSSQALLLQHEAKKQPEAVARATLVKALTYDYASAAGIAYLTSQPFVPNENLDLKRKLLVYETAGLTQAEVNAAKPQARRLADTFVNAMKTQGVAP